MTMTQSAFRRSTAHSRSVTSRSPLLDRPSRRPSRFACFPFVALLLFAASIGLTPRPAAAGPALEIWATDPGDPETNVDDLLVQTPLRWSDKDRPVKMVLYRDFSTYEVIVPNPNEILSEDIRKALIRAIEEWNDVDYTDFEFSRSVAFSDWYLGFDENLPFGPYQVQLDNYNLVTFQDPNLAALPDDVLGATSLFYFTRDFDFRGIDDIPAGYLVQEVTGGVGAITLPDQLAPSLFLDAREYKAGEIVEADIVMDPAFPDWQLYPEDPDDLDPSTPRDSIRGDVDVQAIFLRELGHVAGLTNTLLELPVMAETYRSRFTDVDPEFRVDPYDARQLKLDDQLGMAQAYPSGSYFTAAGIEGDVRDGRAFDNNGGTDAPFPYVPDTAVFFGRQLVVDPPYLPTEELLDSVEEVDVGLVFLEAMTLSGRNMAIPGSSGAADFAGGGEAFEFYLVPAQWIYFGVSANGIYELHGLPPGEWYVYVDTDTDKYSWTWDTGNRGLFGQIAEAPAEFYGGVDGRRPLGGDGTAPENNTAGDGLIGTEYLEATMLPTQQVGLAINASDITGDDINDRYRVIIDVESFGEITAQRTGDLVGLIDPRPLVLRNKARPFGTEPLDQIQENDLQDILSGSMDVPTPGGQANLLRVNATCSLGPYEGDPARRTFYVNYTLENTSTERQHVTFSQVYWTYPAGVPSGNATLLADDEQIPVEKGFGATEEGPYADPLPSTIRYLDARYNPSGENIFHLTGSLVTPPDNVIVGEFQRMQSVDSLTDYVPRGTPLLSQFLTQGVPFNQIGVLYRWNTFALNPGDARTFKMAVTFRRNDSPTALRDGPIPADTREAVLYDFPGDGLPLPLSPGEILQNIIIYTNTGEQGDLLNYEDYDADGVPNASDNCPWVPNPGQEISDNSFPRGIACVDDYDNDGVLDNFDNCPEWPNRPDPSTGLQSDIDGDGLGDPCDPDIDDDGVPNEEDNCLYVYNPDQADDNNNLIGDACEVDFDNDGVPSTTDNCPRTPNPGQEDTDGDGIGDDCDTDIDGDGVPNVIDNCPFVPNPDQEDTNGNGIGDACEDVAGPGGGGEAISLTYTESAKLLENLDIFVKGAAFGDVNGDGFLDIVVAVMGQDDSDSGSSNRVYINQGFAGDPGKFIDETFGIDGVPDSQSGTPGPDNDRIPKAALAVQTWDVKLADFDLDGDLDIYFSSYQPVSDFEASPYGAPDRLLINVDIDDRFVNPFYDNDDLGDGFFVDVTEDYLPGVLNTRGMVGLNTMALMNFGNPDIPVYTVTTRSEITDVDCDGDPDIIVSAWNPAVGGVTLGGLCDFAGTFVIVVNPDTGELEQPFLDPLNFSERILINRRDELEWRNAEGQFEPIPRGVPDAFEVFKQQDENTVRRRFNPDPDPLDVLKMNHVANGPSVQSLLGASYEGTFLGRRLDKFLFRDETLGRDGVFGGSLRIYVDQSGNFVREEREDYMDRLPPSMPNLTTTGAPTHPFSSWENDFSITREVIAGNLFITGSGPEFFVINQTRALPQEPTESIMEGYNPAFANLDLFRIDSPGLDLGSDLIDDGYFLMGNFGVDSVFDAYAYGGASALNDILHATILTIPDGWAEDATGAENDTITLRRAHDIGGFIGDFNGGGSNEIFIYPDHPNPNGYTMHNPTWQEGDTIFFTFEFTRGSLYGAGIEMASDAQYWSTVAGRYTYGLQQFFPAHTGRTTHGTLTDIDRDGDPDILLAQDTNQPINVYVPLSGGGPQVLWTGDTENLVADDWTVSSNSYKPNTLMAGNFIMAGDVDNDGDDDVAVFHFGGQSRLYINDLYRSNPEPPPAGTALPANHVNLAVNPFSAQDAPMFYDMSNQTLPPYAEESIGSSPNLSFSASVTFDIAPGDYDRDGDPDLLFVNGGENSGTGDPSFLLYNRGISRNIYATRAFHSANRAWPAPRLTNPGFPNVFFDPVNRPGYGSAVFDYDQDGDLDIFVTYFQRKNRLFENRDSNDDRLYDNHEGIQALGATGSYYNSLDLYDTDPRDRTSFLQFSSFSALYISSQAALDGLLEVGDGVFEDVTDDVDMPAGGRLEQVGEDELAQYSKYPAIGDFNLDTHIDVVIANGVANTGIPNILLLNSILDPANPRTRRFVDASETLPQRVRLDRFGNPTGVVEGLNDATVQAVASDFNADGKVDIFFVNRNAQDSAIEEPASPDNPSWRPNFVWYSRLLLNTTVTGGGLPSFQEQTDFVNGHSQADFDDSVFHRRFTFAKACDLNQDGDYAEDADGNGIVTDEEILAFENLIESLNRLTPAEHALFNSTDPLTDTFNDARIRYLVGRPPVDQLIPSSRLRGITRSEVPHDTVPNRSDLATLWRRKPRWIDRDGNGQFNPSYDLILTAETGGPVLLLNTNDGTGRFTNATADALGGVTFTSSVPLLSVDVGDLDLNGKPDIILGRVTPDPGAKSVQVLLQTSELAFAYVDVTASEFPDTLMTQFRPGLDDQDSGGSSRAVRLVDVDGDMDFDIVVGNQGRPFGSSWYGALNEVVFNRIRGASWNARQGLYRSRNVGNSGPIIQPYLQVTYVSPQFVARDSEQVLRIYGTRFEPGLQTYFGHGIQVVGSPRVLTDQLIEVRVRVSADCMPGPRPVTVKNPDGESARSDNNALYILLESSQPVGPTTTGAHWLLYQ